MSYIKYTVRVFVCFVKEEVVIKITLFVIIFGKYFILLRFISFYVTPFRTCDLMLKMAYLTDDNHFSDS